MIVAILICTDNGTMNAYTIEKDHPKNPLEEQIDALWFKLGMYVIGLLCGILTSGIIFHISYIVVIRLT